MPVYKFRAEVARPCDVLITAKSPEKALKKAQAGEYDEVINEQGGGGCEEVRIFADNTTDAEEWEE